MKPSHVKKSIQRATEKRTPVMLWGPPGVGKSDIVREIAEDYFDGNIIDLRLAQLDPVDLRGIPSVKNGITHWNTPSFLPTEGRGILFLDELPAAPPAMQTVAYQLIHDRRVGDYHLPDEYAVIAAGNRAEDRAITHRMSTALANRFLHIDYDIDTDDWAAWAVNHNISPEIIAFIRYRPELLHKIDFDNRSFPTPRTWEIANRFLHDELEFELIAGSIGEGTTTEFLGFTKIARNLPQPEDIIAHPKTASVPTDVATLWAVSSLLAYHTTEGNIGNIIKYLFRIPADYQITAMRDILKRQPDLFETEEVMEWIEVNEGVLI